MPLKRLPANHSGLGLGLLGYDSKELVTAEEFEKIGNEVLANEGLFRPIFLKELPEPFFSTDFALKMMAIFNILYYKQMKNFYSVLWWFNCIAGGSQPNYAAGFSTANWFTYMEHYIAGNGFRVALFLFWQWP